MMTRLIPILLLVLTGCDRPSSPAAKPCTELAGDAERTWVLECIKADAAPAGFSDGVMCSSAGFRLFGRCR
jgi:hypothetical protein